MGCWNLIAGVLVAMVEDWIELYGPQVGFDCWCFKARPIDAGTFLRGSFAFNGTSSGLDWLVGGLTRGEW